MLMYGKETRNRKQEIDRQHHTIPNKRIKEELSTVEVKQKDGSVKKAVDEDLKQSIILKLLEEIPNFEVEEEK